MLLPLPLVSLSLSGVTGLSNFLTPGLSQESANFTQQNQVVNILGLWVI